MSEREETADELARFLNDARPQLVRALLAARGVDDAEDAASEAMVWAVEHQDELATLTNPIGYLYRVAQTRSAPRKRPPNLPQPQPALLPEVEPGLVPALLDLPETQRSAVWLVHACGWTYAEVAEALGVGLSTVGTHVSRGLASLRSAIGQGAE